MEPTVQTPDSTLDEVIRRRAELRLAIAGLEDALAASATGRDEAWSERVHASLVDLAADFQAHLTVTEGPDGLHQDILTAAPRMAHAVSLLGAEHVLIERLLAQLLAMPLTTDPRQIETVRIDGTALIGHLIRHRQRGADLVFEAFEAEVGGED